MVVLLLVLLLRRYTVLFWKDFNLTPAEGFGWKDAMVCEILYTFMLCFVVLNVAAAKAVHGRETHQRRCARRWPLADF